MKTLEQFIAEQPDERPVDFTTASVDYESDCGCLLVHWGRDNGLRGRISAGYSEVSEHGGKELSVPDIQFSRNTVVAGTHNHPKTYGELRTLLNP